MAAPEERRETLRRLRDETFDLLIVGGGINGVGIAREAALRGLRTAVVDKGDFASGTSSCSSKLIHGGLRYLETGDFALVLEACRERDLLRRRLAPHLVRPLPFVYPVYRDDAVGMWKLRAGMIAYDALAAFRNLSRHRMLSVSRLGEEEPALRADELRGGALYYDCWTDDARLVIENMLAAEEAGALCLNYASVTAFEKDRGRIRGLRLHDGEGEGSLRVSARLVVNATGPWLDQIRLLDDASAVPCLRPTKGVHIVLPRDRIGNRHALTLHAVRDGRVLFVIPWDDRALVGTTDTDYRGDPDAARAEAGDVDYLLQTVNHFFPRAALSERDVVSTFAGIRPLVSDGSDAPSAVSREEALFESPSGLLSIGGGKLTTYRRVAIKVVDRAAAILRRDAGIEARETSGTDHIPLPGARVEDADVFVAELQAEEARGGGLVARLTRRYGSRAEALLARLGGDPAHSQSTTDGPDSVRAEAWFGAATERALHVEDVLRRRTSMALKSGDGGVGAADVVASGMAEALDWDDRTRLRRAREYVESPREVWRRTSAAAKRKQA